MAENPLLFQTPYVREPDPPSPRSSTGLALTQGSSGEALDSVISDPPNRKPESGQAPVPDDRGSLRDVAQGFVPSRGLSEHGRSHLCVCARTARPSRLPSSPPCHPDPVWLQAPCGQRLRLALLKTVLQYPVIQDTCGINVFKEPVGQVMPLYR